MISLSITVEIDSMESEEEYFCFDTRLRTRSKGPARRSRHAAALAPKVPELLASPIGCPLSDDADGDVHNDAKRVAPRKHSGPDPEEANFNAIRFFPEARKCRSRVPESVNTFERPI
jgi:hypothetical protein